LLRTKGGDANTQNPAQQNKENHKKREGSGRKKTGITQTKARKRESYTFGLTRGPGEVGASQKRPSVIKEIGGKEVYKAGRGVQPKEQG